MRYRTYLQIEKWLETGQDSAGQPTGSWRTCGEWYGSVKTLGGRQVEVARQLFDQATHQIEGHWHPELATNRRIRVDHSGQILSIGHVDNWELKNRTVTVYAAEQVSP